MRHRNTFMAIGPTSTPLVKRVQAASAIESSSNRPAPQLVDIGIITGTAIHAGRFSGA